MTTDISKKTVGQIVTFFSYKGGVGRSMALANVGVLLAQAGHRVLLLDWDLEAPGLEMYFGENRGKLSHATDDHPGIVDLLLSVGQKTALSWQDCINQVQFSGGELDLISAGKKDGKYKKNLRKLDWGILYKKHFIGDYIDGFRDEIKAAYDFVLVDSRTGITDIGDICTVILPDILITVFSSNRQNVDGCRDVVERARKARDRLPVDRSKLVVVPLAARDESDSEYEQASRWRGIFSKSFGDLLNDWLPDSISATDYFDRYYVPYIPNWSFGERLPVLESPRELSDPKTIGASYLAVSRLLESRLQWYKARGEFEDGELENLKTRDIRIRRAEAKNLELGEIRERQDREFEQINEQLQREVDRRLSTEKEQESNRKRLTYLASVAGVVTVMSTFGIYYSFQQSQSAETDALIAARLAEQQAEITKQLEAQQAATEAARRAEQNAASEATLLAERTAMIAAQLEAQQRAAADERARLLSLVDEMQSRSSASEARLQELLETIEKLEATRNVVDGGETGEDDASVSPNVDLLFAPFAVTLQNREVGRRALVDENFDLEEWRSFFEKIEVRHFTPEEFLVLGPSNGNESSRCAGLNSFPPRSLWSNSLPLIRVLDSLRDRTGRPIRVVSAFRNSEYNSCINGSTNSTHLRFQAADIVALGLEPVEVAEVLTQMRNAGQFSGGIGIFRSFVHLDVRGRNVSWDSR